MTSAPILVVDDDRDIRSALRLALESEGYEVLEARNGAEAIDLLESGARPRAIVLDLMMPGMNGWEFREQQLVRRLAPDVPVLVLSVAALRATGIGARRVLAKPVDLDVFLAAVRELAGGAVSA